MFVVHVVWETMTTISDDGELALGIADNFNDGVLSKMSVCCFHAN